MTRATKITSQVRATSAGKVASIRIVDYIGEWEQSSSRSLRQQVDGMIAEKADSAEVYINSRGGNVFEASEIVNELKRFSQVKVRVGALAASAATYITSKFTTTANPNSQFMIHRPLLSTGGDVNKIESDLKLLKNITEDYKATYAAKTGKNAEEIEALWAKGDYWMTAKEALEGRFIDEIASSEAEAVTAEDVALLEACGAPVIPELGAYAPNQQTPSHSLGVTNTQNLIADMERNKIIAALGLAADATDEQIEARAAQLKIKAGSYDTLIAANQAAAKTKAKELVAEALKAKKITAAEVEKYEKMAEADYDFVKDVLAKLGSTPKLSAQLNTGSAGADGAYAGWTMQDYLDKDPAALQKLYEEDPDKVKELEANYFK